VVCDAGPPIHLNELGCLDLLADLEAVWLPRAVEIEVGRHQPEALDEIDYLVPEEPAQPDSLLKSLIQTLALDHGEQAALAHAAILSDVVFLTDDAAARLAAKTMGLRVHGSLGILLRAIRRRQRSRDEIVEILRSIPSRSTLYLRQSLLEEVIAKVVNHDIR
jgi:predicted nucleic acid-binding protein